MHNQTMLEAALASGRKGLAVFPVLRNGKRPLIRLWQQQATTEEAAIRAWWGARFPGANIGIACSLSGLVVVDLDVKDGRDGPGNWAALLDWLSVHHDDGYHSDGHHSGGLDTVTVHTPSGGLHLYFAAPEGVVLRNTAGRLGEGIDTRAEGGYVVAPPSYVVDDARGYEGRYTWGEQGELLPLPAAVVDLLRDRTRDRRGRDLPIPRQLQAARYASYVQAALDDEVLRVARARPGTRNHTLNLAAYALGQLVAAPWARLERAVVEEELARAAAACGLDRDGGCGPRGIEATVRSGLEAGMAQPRPVPVSAPSTTARVPASGAVGVPSLADPVQEDVPSSASAATAAQSRAGGPLSTRAPDGGRRDGGNGHRDALPTRLPSLADDIPSVEGEATSTWPYSVQKGRLVYHLPARGDQLPRQAIVADLYARIANEITTEEGERLYCIEGRALHGGPFSCEIAAEAFSEARKLCAAISAAAGARDPVRARMAVHLGPAIKLLTGPDLLQTRRYRRTGWAEGRFLIPGREPEGVQIELPRKLPYRVDAEASLAAGMEALEGLLLALGPERGTVLLAFALQGPLAQPAGWRNERYGLFITGRTGSLKTSVAQVCMALYGADHMRDDLLIKWGEGATRNAMMALAVHAHDLPLLLDNFKPNTGGGVRALIALVHNILEGGEKDRLDRASRLKATRPIYCWPLITGEDCPDRDPATLARLLVLPFERRRGQENEHLSRAQALAAHLNAVGDAWLRWLEGDEGAARAAEAEQRFVEMRQRWAGYLCDLQPEMGNVLRVASNLASNQAAYWAARCNPAFGDLLERYVEAHQAGLALVARTVAGSQAAAQEGVAFLDALRQLLDAGQVYLLPLDGVPPGEGDGRGLREVFAGWQDGAGGAYLIPAVARQMVERLIGPQALGGLSNRALYAQLDELGAIASKSGDQHTRVVRIGGRSKRVLHIAATGLAVPGKD